MPRATRSPCASRQASSRQPNPKKPSITQISSRSSPRLSPKLDPRRSKTSGRPLTTGQSVNSPAAAIRLHTINNSVGMELNGPGSDCCHSAGVADGGTGGAVGGGTGNDDNGGPCGGGNGAPC